LHVLSKARFTMMISELAGIIGHNYLWSLVIETRCTH